ncbi:MAG: exosortase A [Novosphingobium sp.]
MLPSGQVAMSPGLGQGLHPPLSWRRPLLLLGLAWLALIVLLRADWTAMADQWWNISTYNHVLLIPPIIAWLVWQRLDQLGQLQCTNWWPGLMLFASSMLLWLLGAFAGLAIIRQVGAVALLITTALALLGPRVGAGLAFPLGYMLMLVPFGEELVAPMQMVTAAITVALVHASGIPATIDGVFIDTPAGLFKVAEACSGVMFLVAMFAFGVLAAHVCFISWRRRIGFMALTLAVPVLANGIRAWGTVFAAQYVGVKRAAGFDHIIYGWIFFALVIAATLALAWRWFDRPLGEPMIDAAAINASPLLARLQAMRIGTAPALAIVAAATCGGLAWSSAAEQLAAQLPRQVALPDVPGWHRVNYAPRDWWEPRASGADHRLLGRYADGQGHQADVFFALYAGQGRGRKAAGFGEGALRPDSGWAWQSHGPAIGWGKSDRLLGPSRASRVAYTAYRTGDLLTGSAARLSLANMQDRFFLRARPTLMLIISAEERFGQPASQSLAAFAQSTGPIGDWMDRIATDR